MKLEMSLLKLTAIALGLVAAAEAALASGTTGAPNNCSEILQNPALSLKQTQEFVAYLDVLIQKKLIGPKELQNFLRELDQDHLINPILEGDAETNPALTIHREGLEAFLKQPLDRSFLKTWAETMLRNLGLTHSEQAKIEAETDATYRKIETQSVPPGRFQFRDMTDPLRKLTYDVELTTPIEVMTTPMTQKQWVDLMGANPSQKKRGPESIKVQIDGKPVEMQPDQPVESITWWSALVAANKLSEKHGLKPVYDLSAVVFLPGRSAAQGNLEVDESRRLATIGINAPDGDYYQAEGYRLPTEAEMAYLIDLEQKQNGAYPLQDRAWNNIDSPQDVALLRPMLIDGRPLYDIVGNVRVWCMDSYGVAHNPMPPRGKNPLYLKDGYLRVNSGLTNVIARGLTTEFRSRESNNRGNYSIGVRFVRSKLSK